MLSIVFCIGLAVDYSTMIAESYSESPFEDRPERLHDALETCGISLLSGFISTFLAGLFLIPCEVQLLRSFGELVCITSFFSLLYALGLNAILLQLFGPEQEKGKIGVLYRAYIKPRVQACLGCCFCCCYDQEEELHEDIDDLYEKIFFGSEDSDEENADLGKTLAAANGAKEEGSTVAAAEAKEEGTTVAGGEESTVTVAMEKTNEETIEMSERADQLTSDPKTTDATLNSENVSNVRETML